MEINDIFMMGLVFLVLIVATFIGSAFSFKFLTPSTTIISDGTELQADPLTLQLLKAWNYANPSSTENWLGGCRVERLSPDEWKINFLEC